MLAADEARLFFERGGEVARVQEEVLAATLSSNAGCEIGRACGFSGIRDPDEYRRRVPLVEYEDLRGAVDRMACGEKGVLTAERVISFFKTSGSRSRPKRIPVTPSLIRDKGRAFGIYWHQIYRDHPALQSGTWIANFGDHVERERTSSGLRVISETSFWNERMQGFQRRDRWPIPPTLRAVADSRLRYFAAARFALQGDLHGVMALNPSTLVVFAETLRERREELLAGLESGALGWPGEVSEEVMEGLRPHLSARPERARALRRDLVDLAPGEEIPWRRLWPELELVLCWQSRGVRPYLRLLSRVCEGVAQRDYITQASEAIMAIPVADGVSGGLLAYPCHFFELIPETEIEKEQPETRLAHELEEGRVYEMAVTTRGGLYRYRMGDCVAVRGFEGGIPVLEFLHRKGHTSSMTGEKLTEPQVLAAAAQASRACGFTPERFLCFPRSEPLPHYGVLITLPAPLAAGPGEEPAGRIRRWVGELDRALQRVNPEYQAKRAPGRLGPPVGLEVAVEELSRLRRDLAAERRISEEQVKMGALERHLDLDRGLAVVRVVQWA